jgi:hypothetical protein
MKRAARSNICFICCPQMLGANGTLLSIAVIMALRKILNVYILG